MCPWFKIDYVVFSVEDFFNLVASDKVKQGSVILFEEIGLAAGNREYYSDRNKLMSKLTQIFRTKNLIVFYTAPRLEMADKQLLCLCTGLIKTICIDRTKNQGWVKIFDPVHYDIKRNNWQQRLTRIKKRSPINPNRMWSLKIKITKIHKPSIHLLNQYEKARNAFTDKIANEGQKKLKQLVEKENRPSQSHFITPEQITDFANTVITNREKYMNDKNFDMAAVQNGLGCSAAVAKRIKQSVRARMVELGFAVLWR